jgi:hypothetical protein
VISALKALLSGMSAHGGIDNRSEMTMRARTWVGWGGMMILTLFVTSCATWPRLYLKEATGHATPAEVAERLGPPQTTWDLKTGATLWTYRYGVPQASDWGGITIVGPGVTFGKGSPCMEYVLRFDRQHVLQAWMRQECRADSS